MYSWWIRHVNPCCQIALLFFICLTLIHCSSVSVGVCVCMCVIPGVSWVFSLALAIIHLAVDTHAHTLTNDWIRLLISQISQHVCTRIRACKNTHTFYTLWFETVSVTQWQSSPGAISYLCQHISVVSVMPFCQMCFWRRDLPTVLMSCILNSYIHTAP